MQSQLKGAIDNITYKLVTTLSFTRLIEFRAILKLLEPKKQERICDIGCGKGILGLKIANRTRCEVHAIDTSVNELKKGLLLGKKQKVKCDFAVAMAEHLPYRTSSFNKVICSSSLEHFQSDACALKEINRILKQSEALLILTVDSFSYPETTNAIKKAHTKVSSVVNYYTYEDLEVKLNKAGFQLTTAQYIHKSFISALFFNLGVALKWKGYRYWIFSLIAYPLCLLSDRLFGIEEGGYCLAVKCKKIARAPY